MTEQDKTLYLLDGSSYFFRAYYSNVRLTRSDGFPTHAVFVFGRMLLALIKERSPTHLFAVFDVKGGTFRDEIYDQYKANRPPMPEDLAKQFEPTLELLQALGVPTVMKEGYEADDLIATFARRALAEDPHRRVVIISGDKDLTQLVGERVSMLDTMKGVIYDIAGVKEKWGIWPDQVRDFLTLKGDASDNIPGVKGVGDKTARKLLMDYGSLDNLRERMPEMRNVKLRQRLEENWEAAMLSRRLVTLDEEVPLDEEIEDARLLGPDPKLAREVLARYEFLSLAKQYDIELAPEEDLAPPPPGPPPGDSYDLFGAPAGLEPEADAGPGDGAEAGSDDAVRYEVITTVEALDAAMERARGCAEVALDTETDSLDVLSTRLVGVSLSLGVGQGWYIPLAHREDSPQISWEEVLRPRLAELFGSGSPSTMLGAGGARENPPSIIGHNLKFDLGVLAMHGLDLRERVSAGFDTMIASYLVNQERARHSLDECALRYLGRRTLSFDEVVPSAIPGAAFDSVDIETATRYAAEDAEVAFALKEYLAPRIEENGLGPLFREIEMPLVAVLGEMEREGVRVDVAALQELSHQLTVDMQRLERDIYQSAGKAFNIASPKQLGEVLFTRLGLPVIKKRKTGPSTDVTVLEELRHQHPLPGQVLEYRHLTKLLGTYVEVLPRLVHPKTGRIHSSYNQAVAATGRLSSSDPNLQNIPVRTAQGRQIRQAFVPGSGMVFVGADYSQIELRVLAHLSEDPGLIETFQRGEDIHSRTAREIFGGSAEDVTRDMRSRAKTINFGVLYGMSAFRLAREFGVPRADAQRFIDRYFDRYPGIKAYMERTIEAGRETGYVTTLLGRRRYIPDLTAGKKVLQKAAERMAINTPVQGTAADVIKKAMVHIGEALRERGSGARLVMQVHDELLFEVPEAEAEAIRDLVVEQMQGALRLSVPLTVDAAIGSNWNDAHD